MKYHVKDHKTMLDKKKLIAFWLERYARRENGKPVTVMFDLSETGINSIVSIFLCIIVYHVVLPLFCPPCHPSLLQPNTAIKLS